MFPYFTIFGKRIYSYLIAALAGIFVCGIYVCRTGKKRGLDDNEIIVTGLFGLLGAFIGGHFLYGITNIKSIIYYICNPQLITSFKEFINVFVRIFGGMVFYGGMIGGVLGGVIYIKARKLPLYEYGDLFAPAIPLFHVFGRIGCFLGGCCYGVESTWGFVVHGNPLQPEINDVMRMPVPLIESGCNLIIFFILLTMYKRGIFKHRLLFIYMLIYPVVRFILEFYRGDSIRGFILGLSTSQFISILLFAFSVIYLTVDGVKKKNNSHENGGF